MRKTIKELEKKYNIGEQTILKWIKNGLLTPQNNYKKGQPYLIDENEFLFAKKYYWNDRTRKTYQIGWNRDIFQCIDIPEKAYWLGFIMADGCLQWTNQKRTAGHFSIDLSGKDINHLKKFSNFIEAQNDIITHTTHSITGKDLVHVQLSCTATLQDLEKLGIKPRKSGKETYIETPFPQDFIRGYYDGDGYIKQDLKSIGCVGGKDILASIQKNFLEELNIVPKTIGKHGIIYRIEYTSKEDRIKIANYLWYDGCVSLDRKQELADKIKKLS